MSDDFKIGHALPPTTPKEENVRDVMQFMARWINENIPSSWGFFLMVFPFDGKPGSLNYVSNGNRKDVLQLMREFIAQCERQEKV